MAAQLSSSSPGLGYWGKELGNKKFEVSRLPVAIFQAVLFSYQDKAQPPLRSPFGFYNAFSGTPVLLSCACSLTQQRLKATAHGSRQPQDRLPSGGCACRSCGSLPLWFSSCLLLTAVCLQTEKYGSSLRTGSIWLHSLLLVFLPEEHLPTVPTPLLQTRLLHSCPCTLCPHSQEHKSALSRS